MLSRLPAPARAAALAAFLLHALAALWVWGRWGAGARGGLLFWMDFPMALLWAGAPGRSFLAASIVVGGAWWAAVAALLALAVGRLARGGFR
jgi:hypothetical protein